MTAMLHKKWAQMGYELTGSILSFGRMCPNPSGYILATLGREWVTLHYTCIKQVIISTIYIFSISVLCWVVR